MTLPPIVPNLIHLARTAASADAAGLWLLSRDQESLENVFYDGLPMETIVTVRTLPVGTMTCGRAVLEKQPVIAPSLRSDPEYACAHNTPVRACFSVPVIGHEGRVHGSLACHFTQERSPSPYDIERNQLFAQLIAFALEEVSAVSRTAA